MDLTTYHSCHFIEYLAPSFLVLGRFPDSLLAAMSFCLLRSLSLDSIGFLLSAGSY